MGLLSMLTNVRVRDLKGRPVTDQAPAQADTGQPDEGPDERLTGGRLGPQPQTAEERAQAVQKMVDSIRAARQVVEIPPDTAAVLTAIEQHCAELLDWTAKLETLAKQLRAAIERDATEAKELLDVFERLRSRRTDAPSEPPSQ